jgi:hypothetical protein
MDPVSTSTAARSGPGRPRDTACPARCSSTRCPVAGTQWRHSMCVNPAAPRGAGGYGAPPVETRRPAERPCKPKCQPECTRTLLGRIDEKYSRLVAVTENGTRQLMPRAGTSGAPMVRAQAWSPDGLQMPCQLRSVTAGLLTRPGRVTTVWKAGEADAAVRLRALAKAASPPAIPYTSAEASRRGRAARTSLKSPAGRGAAPDASIPRDAAR